MPIKLDLRPIDRQFAAFICRESSMESAELWLIAALVSHAVGQAAVCLDLHAVAGHEYLVDGKLLLVPTAENLMVMLKKSAAIGGAGDFRPLLLDAAGRLYLQRYWKYEYDLADLFLRQSTVQEPVNEELLRQGLQKLFPNAVATGELDWQAVAVLAALNKRLCIISGGPGTGKTSTVVKILALLIEQYPDRSLSIGLAAPTGKAAARLKDSVSRMKETLPCTDETKAQIPVSVTTLHRLLGALPDSVRFRFSADNRLPYDVVVIDEASMVDLPLMAKLATALKEDARLILLGDRDQLASVEAGAVLGDICGGGRSEVFSSGFNDLLRRCFSATLPVSSYEEQHLPLTDTVVVLKKNYRFKSGSGIGELAAAVNTGNGQHALNVLLGDCFPQVLWHDMPDQHGFKAAFEQQVIDGYSPYLTADTPRQALARFDQFRVLCALREGLCGVSGVTRTIEEILAEKGLIDLRDCWYKGRPIMITANDYSMKLFNGDVGIVFSEPGMSGAARVYFSDNEGGIRAVSPVRLPAHETVYAMTIHKSQGSEFNDVHIVLPDYSAAALCQELVYTGITRAKNSVAIWGDKDLFLSAVAQRITRTSGLKEALWLQ